MVNLLVCAGMLMISMAGTPGSSAQDPWEGSRRRMLNSIAGDVARNDQVLGRDHLSETVARAMKTVPRHEFVPPEYRERSYANHPLPIGHGQTISQPTIVAMMTDLLELAPTDTVLEVGTGSGYQAAVLAEVVPAGLVHTIEIVGDLAHTARQRLQRLGYANVRVYHGDGYLGLPAAAPFSGIIITAAAPEIPRPLLDQLAPGGRLVMPVGGEHDTQWLTVVHKAADGSIGRKVVLPVRFVPLTRLPEQ